MLLTASSVLLASYPVALIAAAVSDFKRFIIPNWTCLLLLGGFAVAFPFTGLGLAGLWPHLAMFAGAFALGFGLFALSEWGVLPWGAGDSKLLIGVAIWFEPSAAVQLVFWITIIGAALAVPVLAVLQLRKFFPGLTPLWRIDVDRFSKSVPYGVAIAAGALISFPESPIYIALIGG